MDFFNDDDQRVKLGNALVASLSARYSFSDTRQILNEGKTAKMNKKELVLWLEYEPLESAHLTIKAELAKQEKASGKVYPSEWETREKREGTE